MVESPRAELQRPPLCFDDDSSDFEEELLLTQPVERPLAGTASRHNYAYTCVFFFFVNYIIYI